ncbi:hypothetical protein TRAPUB_11394 [Trametes pubescens]|uniref:G3BP-like protein n=1 Tax=Trametes pubescens TaxID=154538 RepID=A0A1M2VWY4_TRAPU|nr:hypothetical protein TRAPUB_11394 [Trametes pubescens]
MTNNTSVNPSEVGWQFVPQYYTFVNKHPHRLHCFYNKSSTFIHGTEGEDGKPCFGQQEIHNKITSIGFQDCKVFIHSVDAQSSANGGIIIQVIGEMSNKGEAWRKFVQTFFLAEQPNGYFVLNDIFRFLKEESVEEGDEQEAEPVQKPVSTEQVVPISPAPASPAPPPPAEPEPVPTPSPAPPAVEERAPSPSPSPAPEPQPQVNGHAPETKREPTPPPRESSPAPAPEPPATASPAPVSPPAQQHQPLAPTPAAPAPAPAQPPQQQQPPPHAAPAPAAPAPSAPKTWASLAATGAKSWGTAVAAQSRGTSEAPAPSSASPAPLSGPQSPAPHVTTRPLARQDAHPALIAAQNVQTAQCFIKGVTENITDAALRTTLAARFGPVKELEIVRSKVCAFLEFTQLDAAKRAIAASLPLPQGGEGGIRIETDGGAGQARVYVETRKERGERPGPRGGAPINGDRGRGGFRGRGGPGRGRGGPPPKQ